ncbi:MAG TPA: alcohol dehydrogenase catalytic domain-containing protein [Candidatus Limnocylindrales bacterium]
MRAAVFEGEGRLVVREVPDPAPTADEVLVEVEACGICGSDVHVLDVPPGHPATPGTVLGHEFVGRITALGEAVSGWRVGQRVVADPDPKCGSCPSCRAGRPADCSRIVALGVYRDGALARLVRVPAASVFAISDAVPAELAALTEPLACVVNGTNRAALRPGESAVVFGGGAIGCLFTAVLRAAGAAPLVVVEPSPGRQPVARAVGADEVLTPDEFAARQAELLPDGAAVVVDAVGRVLPDAIEAAAMGGRIVLFGMDDNACPPIRQVDITRKGLTILGSYITNFTFPQAIRLIESGALDLRPLVSEILPLDRTAEGVAHLRSGQATKVVIRP